MLNNYLSLIEKQRINNPFYKKDYRLIRLPKAGSFKDAVDNLNRYPNAFLSNVIKREDYLYIDNNDLYYYEFIDRGVAYSTNLENWKYFYIPISLFYPSLGNMFNAENKLPSFKYYDVNVSDTIQRFNITKSLLYLNNNNLNIEFVINSNNNSHPLLPHFHFTGACSLLKTGEMLYEYKDIKSYSDEESISYFSFLEPVDIYINSSYLESNQFTEDTNINNIGKLPSKLHLYNNISAGYSGRHTNNKFSFTKKWYEYYIYINGSPSEQIILPYPPTDKDLNFVDVNLYNKNIGLSLPTNINNQNISINQTSLNIPFNLAP